jgi:Fe-S oxidoreductase
MQKFGIKANFEIQSIIQLYAQWIREGKLKPSTKWNDERKIKFTVQDPCQLVRKTFGDPVAEDLRYVVKAVIGEENFIDMYPNRSNNFCCGGGGGFLQSGYPDERRKYGELKSNQILAPGAAYAITPCHNCHAQVHDLAEQRDHAWQTVHLWTLLCLSLGILGPNERVYLGDDLREVDVFHPESEM